MINYIKMLAKQKKRRLPDLVHVTYERRWAPLANWMYDLELNPDRKTYKVLEYRKDNPEAIERDDPYIHLVVNGPPDWTVDGYFNTNIDIPLPKQSKE